MSNAQPSGLRLWAFRLMTLLVLPLLLIVGTEAALRVLNVGEPTGFTVDCSLSGAPARCDNSRFTWQFFPPRLARTPSPVAFPEFKPEQHYRIFVLGASAAMGDPEPAYGFSRMLEVMLQQRFPEIKFEVINTAVTAINSHVVLPIAEDVAGFDPDLFIIYLGNNEVVGPYGAGTVFAPISPNRAIIRTGIYLKSLRLGQLLGKLAPSGDGQSAEWLGMEMFLEQQVRAGAPGLESVYRHYRDNLSAIIEAGREAGARIILSTVGTNLKDSAPFASLHRQNLDEKALSRWQTHYEAGLSLEQNGKLEAALTRYLQAEGIDEEFADLQFRLGRLLLGLGRPEQARERFVLARDFDALRFRADSRINEIVRSLARERDDVELFDADRRLADESPDGIPGSDFFYEHVHFNSLGNYVIASGLLDQISRQLPMTPQGAVPSLEEVERRLVFSRFDEHRVFGGLVQRLENPPFTNQLNHVRTVNALQEDIARLEKMPRAEALREAEHLYRSVLAVTQDDPWLFNNYGVLLRELGRPEHAAEQFRQVLAFWPHSAGAREKLASALEQSGNYQEAVTLSRRLIEEHPYRKAGYYTHAAALAKSGRIAESIATYQELKRVLPVESLKAFSHVGRLHLRLNNYPAAAEIYREAILFNDQHQQRNIPDVHYHLGYALKRIDRTDDAAVAFDRAATGYLKEIETSPDDAALHHALGTTLVERGKLLEATPAFARAVKLAPEQLEYHVNLVNVYQARGMTEQAMDTAERGIAMFEERQQQRQAAVLEEMLTRLKTTPLR